MGGLFVADRRWNIIYRAGLKKNIHSFSVVNLCNKFHTKTLKDYTLYNKLELPYERFLQTENAEF